MDQGFEFFLQERDGNAPVHANLYSLFGGGIEEAETPTEALAREVSEELTIHPSAPIYLMHCSTGYADFFIFTELVGEDFESRIEIHEGAGGRFIEGQDALTRWDVSPIARVAIEGAVWFLSSKKEKV